MGFKTGAYATVWEAKAVSPAVTQLRINVSRKNKNTGEYEEDFSGFVSVMGTQMANKASRLKERDRIVLGDVDVSVVYDKAKKQQYTNFKIFSFEMADAAGTRAPGDKQAQAPKPKAPDVQPVDDGLVEEGSDLPF